MAIDINFYNEPTGLTARELQLGRQCAELRQLLKTAEDELQQRRARDNRVRILAKDWRTNRGILGRVLADELDAALNGPAEARP